MGGYAIVIDLGKTMSKASLWAPEGHLVARRTRANDSGSSGLDVAGIEHWLAEALRELGALAPVTAVIPVGHGAAFAALREGRLACPPPDYEEELTATERAAYGRQRDGFAVTGSPALPLGLNLGAQLHALDCRMPGWLDANTTLLPWAQYWAWRLCGVAASEVTSLGCHTDLWCPATGEFSPLAQARGWAARFAPLRPAGECLGLLTAEWVARTGLSPAVRVHCGLHDSNAALLAMRAYPEIGDGESTVLSTGTWFVALRTPAQPVDLASLPAARDCLVNVDVRGRPVPSARFMGGREIELLTADDPRLDPADDPSALWAALPGADALPLPTQVPGCGPYPTGEGTWSGRPADPLARRAAIAVYAALMADAALDLIGSRQRLVVEGRFAAMPFMLRVLASLRSHTTVLVANAENDASYGAWWLLQESAEGEARRPVESRAPLQRVAPLDAASVTRLHEARTVWRQAAKAVDQTRTVET